VPSLQVTGPLLPDEIEPAAAGAATAAAGAAAVAAGAALAPAAEAEVLMPPWPLQAPRPPCGEVVPSLQVTGPLLVDDEALLAAGAAAAGAAAGWLELVLPAADLLMPPWPLHAPRPPCGDVVPSLQVTGPLELLWASARVGAASSAAASTAAQVRPVNFEDFMCRSPSEPADVPRPREYSNHLRGGTARRT
jgi:hypothetical protein